MTRGITAGLTLALILILLVFDLATAELNPYLAPAPIALGSGVLSAGGFCGQLPE